MAGTTAYNLNHLQVAARGATPTYRDVNYAISAEFTIEQDSESLQADGKNVVSTFGAREGTGSISFGSMDLSTIALMTGDSFSSSGVEGTDKVERLEFLGSATPPGVILSAWVKNVDGNSAFAGTRITVPNAKLSVPNASFEQESWSEFESDVTFNPDGEDVLLIWENMEVEPGFTDGVMPVALTPITP